MIQALGLVVLGGVMTVPLGCSSACSELQDICDDCRDPNHRANCERSVDEDPEDVCELNVDAYRNVCR